MPEDCPCVRQALFKVEMVAAIDHGAIIVVPEISL